MATFNVTTPAFLQITDCITVPGGGTFDDDLKARVSGFYKIKNHTPNNRVFIPCLPDDPEMEVISSSGVSGHFHRPWEVRFDRFIPWDKAIVDDRQTSWSKKVDRGYDFAHGLTSNGYPSLFEEYTNMSAHERLSLQKWRVETTLAINDARTKVEQNLQEPK